MALIDIYTLSKGMRILAQARQTEKQIVWKCGACQSGNVATATNWEDIEIRDECPKCKKQVEFDILGK